MAQPPERDGINNRLLKSLPPATLDRLRPSLELVNAPNGQVIDHIDRPIDELYFMNRGLVSVVKTMQDGRTVEVGAVGIEGVTDPNSLFGSGDAALETIVQVPGTAFRIKRDVLKREIAKDDALRESLERYTRFAFGQLVQTAACNRLHSMEERCCRWLLIAHDNALSDTFPLTHEFLAMMLGVRRAGISVVASYLKKAGLIEYKRSSMTITDRAGLEDAACECYGFIQGEMKKLYRRRRRQRSSGT